MNTVEIRKNGITKLDTDAVVNAANTGLLEGGGVCGYIFHDTGSKEMTAACQKIGHYAEGSDHLPDYIYGSCQHYEV